MTATAEHGSPRAPADGLRLARVGLAAAMGSRLAGRLVGILLVVVLAREASAATVAVYGYLLGTATLVLVVTDLGVASVAGREVAAGRLPPAGALRAALPIQLVSVLVAGGVTAVVSVLWGPHGASPVAVAVTIVIVLVGGLNNLWADLLRGSGRVMLEGGLELGSTVLLVVAGVLVVAMGGGATALIVVVALKEAAVLAVGWAVLRPRRHAGVRSASLLGQGVWVAIAGTAIVLLLRQGMLVVGALGSIGTLATYVVATRFFDAGVTVAHTVGFGLGPGMAALAADPAAFRRAARRYLGLITGLGVLVALAGALLAGPITTLPFGATWGVAVPAVRVVALSGLPVLLSYVSFTLLMARRQVRWLAFSTVAATLVALGTTAALVLARPTALSGMVGTAIGATTLAVLLLTGLRDMFRPARAGQPYPEREQLHPARPAA